MERIFSELEKIAVFTLEQQLNALAWNIEIHSTLSEKKMVFVDGGANRRALALRISEMHSPALRASHLRNLRIGYTSKREKESETLVFFDDKPSSDIRVTGQILVREDILNDSFQQRDKAIRTVSGLASCAARTAFQAIETAGILSLLNSLRPNSIIVGGDGNTVVVPSKQASSAVFEALSVKSEAEAKRSLGMLVKRATEALNSSGGDWAGSPYYCEVLSTCGRPLPVFVMPLQREPSEGHPRLFGVFVHGRVEPLASGAMKSLFNLTPAEANVTRLALMGLRPKSIAQGMQVSTETVRTYLSRIYQKLNVQDRGELIATMTEMGTMIGEPLKSDLATLPRATPLGDRSSLIRHASV